MKPFKAFDHLSPFLFALRLGVSRAIFSKDHVWFGGLQFVAESKVMSPGGVGSNAWLLYWDLELELISFIQCFSMYL